MAIFTPRGLKIRIDIPYAFALMARLSSGVSPFRILKTAEGIEHLPAILAFTACMVSFAYRLSPTEVGALTGCAHLLGVVINMFGLYLPGVVWLATAVSYVAGYGLFIATMVIVGFFTVGWPGIAAFIAGKAASSLLTMALEGWRASYYKRVLGYPFFGSEVAFFNAYRAHASRLGITTDIELQAGERLESYWRPTLDRFVEDWPEIASRFTTD